MQLEDQVCNIKLAKKLRKLGVKQDSLFWHVDGVGICYLYDEDATALDQVSAFTSAELGRLLPQKILLTKRGYAQFNSPNIKLRKKDTDNNELEFILISEKRKGDEWHYYYMEEINAGFCIGNFVELMGKTEADARAKLLIYLLENNLCTIN